MATRASGATQTPGLSASWGFGWQQINPDRHSVAGTVSPSYLLPLHGLQRLEKLIGEGHAGSIE